MMSNQLLLVRSMLSKYHCILNNFLNSRKSHWNSSNKYPIQMWCMFYKVQCIYYKNYWSPEQIHFGMMNKRWDWYNNCIQVDITSQYCLQWQLQSFHAFDGILKSGASNESFNHVDLPSGFLNFKCGKKSSIFICDFSTHQILRKWSIDIVSSDFNNFSGCRIKFVVILNI